MASGGSKTQTTTQNSQPWAGAVPGLQTAMSGALNQYNQGMPEYYHGSTVAGMNGQQMAGINGIKSGAGMAGQLAQTGTNALNGIINGKTDVSGFDQFKSGQPNPYLGDLYSQGARGVTDDVNAQFSKAGRYGSGAQTNVLSRNLGDMWTNLAAPAYENDRNRALSAANSVAGYSAGDRALNLNAANSLGGMYDLSQAGNKDMLGVGQLLQEQRQKELDDQVSRWNYNQNAPRANVEWLNNIASQQGGLGSTSTGTGANPNHRSASDNLMGLGSTLGAAWLMSDRRLKADIVPLADGWYSFRYVWEEPGTEHFGVMADEAPAHAVAHDEHHFSVVGYHLL
jgi:hypothetical protein